MKNKICCLIFLVFFAAGARSQNIPLAIEGSAGKFYLDHTVVAKENWYSIGRLFNLPPHDIATFNNISFDKPLDIGQQIHIPLTSMNFDQKGIKAAGETLVPVYHTVQEKEWIFKISSIYNDVPVSSLEKWNKVKRDDVKQGMTIIVGYLKVKSDLSPLANGVAANPVGNVLPAASTAASLPKSTVVATPANSTPPAAQTKTIVPATSTSPAPAATIIPVSNTGEKVNNYATTHSNGGFFSSDFTAAGKSLVGQAGTFKSTSGWSDGKYYALMNGVPVGTIIRVVASNGKAIYAKVLGQLPDMKESNGLIARISNASSAELGLGEGKFPVEIKY